MPIGQLVDKIVGFGQLIQHGLCMGQLLLEFNDGWVSQSRQMRCLSEIVDLAFDRVQLVNLGHALVNNLVQRGDMLCFDDKHQVIRLCCRTASIRLCVDLRCRIGFNSRFIADGVVLLNTGSSLARLHLSSSS